MPETFTGNCARMETFNLTVDQAAAHATARVGYRIGNLAGSAFTTFSPSEKSIEVVIPLASTLSDGLTQIAQAIAAAEGLTLTGTTPDQVITL